MIGFDNDKCGRPEARYLLMDVNSRLLATGNLISPPDAHNMQLQVTEGSIDDLVAAHLIQAIPQDDQLPMRLGRITLRRGKSFVLEPMRELGEDARQNLRMPVDFESFVYFREGGRAPVQAVDLSCGGIAFCADCRFQLHEEFEIVIPITEEGPLILEAKILREKESGGRRMYAAKFINMIHDQEARVREAVFHVQVLGRILAPAGS